MSATGNPAADIAAVTKRFLQFFANRDFAGLASCYTEDAQMLVASWLIHRDMFSTSLAKTPALAPA